MKNSINAKDLYEKLEVKTRFNDWILRRLNNTQAVQNYDFVIHYSNLSNIKYQ